MTMVLTCLENTMGLNVIYWTEMRCLLSPCGCHYLNLCCVDAAACNTEEITFFGVQTVYNVFSASPTHWEILLQNIGCSVHSLSQTRWTAHVASVRPFAAHLPEIATALQKILTLNLTAKTKYDINGAFRYVKSFICIVMASVWLKVFVCLDYRNQVIQARDEITDVEVSNLERLLTERNVMRNNKWINILEESKNVAGAIGIEAQFVKRRSIKRRRFNDEREGQKAEDNVSVTSISTGWAGDIDFEAEDTVEDDDKRNIRSRVYYDILDCVIAGLSSRFNAVLDIHKLFKFLWNYKSMTEIELCHQATAFAVRYSADVSSHDLWKK